MVAPTAPRISCPWPPMSKRPARNASAIPRPAIMSGVVDTRVSERGRNASTRSEALPEPRASTIIARAADGAEEKRAVGVGDCPPGLQKRVPGSLAEGLPGARGRRGRQDDDERPDDQRADEREEGHHDRVPAQDHGERPPQEGRARRPLPGAGAEFPLMPSLLCSRGNGASRHEEPDLLAGEAGRLEGSRQPSPVHDDDPVRERHDLVQLRGDQEHRRSRVPRRHQPAVHVFDGADVQPSRRLGGDDEPDGSRKLAGDDHLLLVAAREGAHPDVARRAPGCRNPAAAARRPGRSPASRSAPPCE